MNMKRAHRIGTSVYLALLFSGADYAPAAAATRPQFRLVTVSAPPQTVEVTTRAGSYTAVFQNEARIEPNGRADGILEVTAPNGEPLTFRVVAGSLQSTDRGRTVTVWLLLRPLDADSSADLALAVVRPSAEAEPCRIYDILGTQVNAPRIHFEAEVRIDIIRN